MPSRSYLYVPGDKPGFLEGAIARGADAVIADLEDSVAVSAKREARQFVATWLRTLPQQSRPEIWVRVNSDPETMRLDLEATASPLLSGVYLPKVSSPDDLLRLIGILEHLEPSHVGRTLAVVPLIETATGLERVSEIARSPRVRHLALGEGDLGAELAIESSDDEREWQAIRCRIVVASAAAGISRPIGPTSTDFRDLIRLHETSESLRRLGFCGRSAIHPSQIPVINEVFTPTAAAVESALYVLRLFDEAVRAGRGVAVDERGRMIDEAVVRGARQVVELAKEIGTLSREGREAPG